MTGKDLFREIGNIDEKYVSEAQETKRSVIMNPVFRRTLATAACLVVCLGIFAGVQQVRNGARNESATMQAESNMSAFDTADEMMMEDVAMNSANTQNAATAGDAAADSGTEEGFWEGLWNGKEAATDCAPQEDTVQVMPETDTVTNTEQEKAEDNVEKDDYLSSLGAQMDKVLTFEADVYYDDCVSGGREDVEAFLETAANGEEAVLELVHLVENGTYVCATIHYTETGVYEWIKWHAPTYGRDDVEVPTPIEYEYLKVFEDTLEDGKVYCMIGLGETEGFTLRDLQVGAEGTCFILKYEK